MSNTTKPHDSRTFAQTLTLLIPEVGEALLPIVRRQSLIEMCRELPPLTDGMFEFALSKEPVTIRIQQGVGRGSDVDLLCRYMARGGDLFPAGSSAPRLEKLLAAWQSHRPPFVDSVMELWLQHDFGDESAKKQAADPAMIFGLSQSLMSLDARWSAIQGVLDCLPVAEWREWRDTLLRVVAVCPPQAYISHFAVQWQGGKPWLQVCIKQLRTHKLAQYLDYVAWPGNIADAVACAEQLGCYTEHLALWLDLDREIAPHIRYECSMTSQSPTEPRWAALLDDLVQRGICTAAKRDAYLAWAGMATPLLTDGDWPDRLIVESLTRPTSHLSVLQRRFGSIKVDLAANGETAAYGALRFSPRWLRS